MIRSTSVLVVLGVFLVAPPTGARMEGRPGGFVTRASPPLRSSVAPQPRVFGRQRELPGRDQPKVVRPAPPLQHRLPSPRQPRGHEPRPHHHPHHHPFYADRFYFWPYAYPPYFFRPYAFAPYGAFHGSVTAPSVVDAPFYCWIDRREFDDEAAFTEHLRDVHGVPPEDALSASTSIRGGYVFFGKRGRGEF